MGTGWVAPFALAMALAVAGCGGTSEPAADPVDIRDAVLTRRSGDCADYASSYTATVSDLKRDMGFTARLQVTGDGGSCVITSNDIPNYDFDDGSARFAEPVATQAISVWVPRHPERSSTPTGLSLLINNAVMLNGVILDQLANGCYKPDDPMADPNGNTTNGCGPVTDWRLDPLGAVSFGTDSHNAHVQPGGLYHYHGNPMALFDPAATTVSPVIGFAADGFPIYGPYYRDDSTGEVRRATSGYTLKSGERPARSSSSPGGAYDGTYIEDYEFTGAGTLDECNGMTVDGQYGYYVTETYPYVMGCFSGTPDLTFYKWSLIPAWAIGIAAGLLIGLSVLLIGLLARRRRSPRGSSAA
jgi:hypothetical protein